MSPHIPFLCLGTKRVSGKPGLKMTQAYPEPFGCQFAQLYLLERPRLLDEYATAQVGVGVDSPSLSKLLTTPIDDCWRDAHLDRVLTYVKQL
jgi:hypothetical protein